MPAPRVGSLVAMGAFLLSLAPTGCDGDVLATSGSGGTGGAGSTSQATTGSDATSGADGPGGAGGIGAPDQVGSIELRADPTDVGWPGGNTPNTTLAATFGEPPRPPCVVEYEDEHCVTVQCEMATASEPGDGHDAGTLTVTSDGRTLTASIGEDLGEGASYREVDPESLWTVGGVLTVSASGGDDVPAFSTTLATTPLVEVPGWEAAQTLSRDADFVQAVAATDGAIALELYAHDTGDFPVWRVRCVFDASAEEVRIPAAAMAGIAVEDGGLLWIDARAETTVAAGDHLVTVGAETMSAWATFDFE